jgi:hypothetical protein
VKAVGRAARPSCWRAVGTVQLPAAATGRPRKERDYVMLADIPDIFPTGCTPPSWPGCSPATLW